MTQFRIIINGLVSEWQDASEWSIDDLLQFQEFGDYQVEYR